MKAHLFPQSVVSILMLMVSLVGCRSKPPVIPFAHGSDAVEVYEKFDVDHCEDRGRISAEDGIDSGGSRNFEGTYDWVLQLLRNEAVKFGANTVVIDERLESLSHGPGNGFVIKIYAHGYRC